MTERLEPDLVLLNAHQMATLRGPKRARRRDEMGHLGTVPKAAVAFKGEMIIYVGSTEFLRNKADLRKAQVIDVGNRFMMPGFVDAHTHAVFAGSREDELVLKMRGTPYKDIMEGGGGIHRTVSMTRHASIGELVRQTKPRFDVMLQHGTTTAEVKSGYGLTTKDEMKVLEATRQLGRAHPINAVPTFLGAHAIPQEYAKRPDDYVDLIIDDMLPRVAEQRLARYSDVFCDAGAFTVPQARKILLKSKELGLPARIHADELSNIGASRLAAELGAASADHLLHSNAEDHAALAKAKVVGTLLPGAPFMLIGAGYAPARAMVDAGVPLALGTDLNPNCWIQSMQTVVALACLKMKLTIEEAIHAATANAAYALGVGDEVGSLEPGKRGDVIVFDFPTYLHMPYRHGTNNVWLVVKDGNVLVDRRQELEGKHLQRTS